MDAMIETNTQGSGVPQQAQRAYVATEADVKAATEQAKRQSPPTPEEIAQAKRIRRAAYFGIRPGTRAQCTPEAFEEDATPPVFHFEMLTATEKQEFFDLFSADGKLIRAKLPEAQRWMLDRKLLPWEGFKTAKDVEIPFERDTGRLTAACWDCIPIPLRADLMSIILSTNEVDQKDAQGVKS